MAGTRPDGYRVFTTKYDREVGWWELDSVLGPLSADGAKIVSRSLAEFEAALPASCAMSGGQEPSGGAKAAPSHRKAVTLLLDQSGSMRGTPMALAAAAIARAVRRLTTDGCRVEVLGFTTVSWKGGRPRGRWKWLLRPRRPGRLCEILHIIYRAGDEEGCELSDAAVRAMLRPDLPKENIDGEAVAWAASRLRAGPEPSKILLVLSDGSPVDDSTQQANGPFFLDDHLRSVLQSIQQEGRIRIAAVGIGHDVSGWYPEAISVRAAADLDVQLDALLDRLLAHSTGAAQ